MNKEYKILDKGFVRLIDHMGSDDSICEAARVSYAANNKKRTEDSNEKLINYLMCNEHTSPFEMAEVIFHVKLPIFVARQWIRHRTGSFNEVSGRYTELTDFHCPDEIREQSRDNKQGSSGEISQYDFKFEEYNRNAFDDYSDMVSGGVAKEQARIVLPLSTFTEWYWKTDLHNLFHFLKLRMHHHAQKEIREYANCIAGIVSELYPLSYGAFLDYKLNAIKLSHKEVLAISRLKDMDEHGNIVLDMDMLSDREKNELEYKLLILGLN